MLNAVYPGFTFDLCKNIKQQKEERVPPEAKITVCSEMNAFLKGSTATGLGKDQQIGMMLKDGRKWSQNRQTQPYDITFKLPNMREYQSAAKPASKSLGQLEKSHQKQKD